MKRKLCLSLVALSLTGLLSAQKLPGTADSTFNGNGYGTYTFGQNHAQDVSGYIDANGKLVILGGSVHLNKWDVGLTRLNLDGSEDMSFRNGTGPSHLDFNNGGNDAVSAIARCSNGDILGVGNITGPNGADLFIVKFDQYGTVQGNFGMNGMYTQEIDPGYEVATHILEDKDGKIVVLGNLPFTEKKMFLIRFYPYGGVDSSFSGDGIVYLDPLGLNNIPVALLERPDGGYYVVSNTTGNSEAKISIHSVSSNGNTNIDLGGPGEVSLQVDGKNAYASSAFMLNKSILIAGNYVGPQNNDDGFLARLEPDGNWNSSFALGAGFAKVVHNLSNPYDETMVAMRLAPDSSIYLCTIASTPDTATLIISRFTSSGESNGFYGNKNGSHHEYGLLGYITEFDVYDMVIDTAANRVYVMGSQNTPGESGFFVYATHSGEFTQSNGGGTGVQRVNRSLKLYPNPASTWLKLDLSEDQPVSVSLFDLQGREVMQSKATLLNTQNLNSGMYIIRAMQDGQVYSAKIQILN